MKVQLMILNAMVVWKWCGFGQAVVWILIFLQDSDMWHGPLTVPGSSKEPYKEHDFRSSHAITRANNHHSELYCVTKAYVR